MKKYQLKYNDGMGLVVLVESEIFYDILKYIDHTLKTIEYMSVWVDGQMLDWWRIIQ